MNNNVNPFVEVYTDGACKGNPGPGGWGVLLRYGNIEKKLYGSDPLTTNNRMELLAAIKGLEALKKVCRIKLITDSIYVKNGIMYWIKNWKKKDWKSSNGKPVKNQDLWVQLDAQNKKHTIEWSWVKGHSGNEGNELADQLASRGAEEAKAFSK